MNWDNIRVFIQTNRLGSIAKAAEQLEMNHSTVLRRLAQLEQELNVKLFTRSTRGYEITPAGEELLVQAIAMEENAITLQRQAASNTQESSGKLAVALPPNGSLQFMPLLAKFRRLHPEIELNLDAQLGLSDLNKLEAEVSIRFTNAPPEDYVGFKVLDIPHKLYASRNYLAQHPELKAIEDIQDWIVITIPKLGDEFEGWVKTINPSATIAARINSTELAAEAVSYDMGITFLSEHMAKLFDNLVEVPINPFGYHMGVWLLTHQDLRYQPRVKAFLEFMREHLPGIYPEYTASKV